MDARRLPAILACVVGISIGQVLLKLAATHIRPPLGAPMLGWHLVNPYLVAGVVVLGISTLGWVWVLRTVALAQAYPYMALCFVLVPLAGILLLGEPVSWRQAAGTALIIAGVAIVGRA
jgi:drug/metabolite transporter (DMT)-like permease